MNTIAVILFYGLTGGITYCAGMGWSNWEFYALMFCVLVIAVNSAIGARK